MFPFHRHHNNSSTSSNAAHKIKGNGGGRSRERGFSREEEPDVQPPPSTSTSYQTRSANHSQLQQQRWDYVLDETTNVLRAKENVLLSSLASGVVNHECNDNSLRFGSNRHNNIFSSLQNLKEVSDADNHDAETTSPTSPPPPRRVIDSGTVKRFFMEGICHMSSLTHSDRVLQGNSSKQDEPPDELDSGASCNAMKVSSNVWTTALQTAIVNQVNINTKLLKSSFDEPRDDVNDDIIIEELDDEFPDNEGNAAEVTPSEINEFPLSRHISEEREVDAEQGFKQDEGVNIQAEVRSAKKESKGEHEDDAPEEVTAVRSAPITPATATALKQLVLGRATATFTRRWMEQGFTFNVNHRLRYGLLHDKDGPCGVLATIQAFLIKTLLFDEDKCTCTDPLRPTGSEARSALITAITDVLWRASTCLTPSLVVGSSDVVLDDVVDVYRRDGLTETLSVATFNSKASLEDGVKQHVDQFTAPEGRGCLLLVMSAILSRGISRVQSDMDDSATSLIDVNGQCATELVNLLLVGQAVSNVFDNSIDSDSGVQRGIPARSEVGLLTLTEHYNACQVGSYLKTPRHPVWLVLREGEYSVLFSCKKELVSDWRVEKHFTLFHYDAGAKQKDEVKLIVDTTGLHSRTREEGSATSTLALCIRTKWKGAVVD